MIKQHNIDNKRRKKRVLFLARRAAPQIGGVETHLERICPLLAKKGYDLTVVAEGDKQYSQEQHEAWGRVIRLPLDKTANHKLQIWQWWWQHRDLLQSADDIHIHDVFFWLLPFLPLLWWWQKKVFITFHGYEAPGPLTWSQVFWHRVASCMCHGSIGVGAFHTQMYGVVPTLVTYGGNEVEIHGHQKKQRLPGKKQLLFVGRVEADTGLQTYLSGLAVLPHQTYKLDIYGDGQARQALQAFAQRHQLSVTWHGAVPDALRHVVTCDMLLSSQYLGILSGLAAGKPVLTVSDSPLKSIYLNTAAWSDWVMQAETAEEVAAAVLHCLPPPSAAQLWAQKQTWTAVATLYEVLWKK